MSRLSRGVCLAAALSLSLGAIAAHAGTFTSVASGDWNSPTTWGGSATPGAGDNVTIAAGHTVTAAAAMKANDVRLSSGGTLQPSTGSEFQSIFSDGGTLAPASGATFTVAGWGNLSTSFVANNSTVIFSRTSWGAGGTTIDRVSGTFANVTIPAGMTVQPENGFVVTGTLKVDGTFASSSFPMIGPAPAVRDIQAAAGASVTSPLTITGNITSANLTLFGGAGSNSPSITFDGNGGTQTVTDNIYIPSFTVGSSGRTTTVTGRIRSTGGMVNSGSTLRPADGSEFSGDINGSGSVTPAAGATITLGSGLVIHFVANNSTVVFSKTSWGGGSNLIYWNSADPFENVTVSGAVQLTVGGSLLRVNGTLNLQGSISMTGGEIDVKDFIAGPASSLPLSGTLVLSGDLTTSNPQVFGAPALRSGTVTFIKSGTQAVSGAPYLPQVYVGGGSRGIPATTTTVAGKLRAQTVQISSTSTLQAANGSELLALAGGTLMPQSGATVTIGSYAYGTFSANGSKIIFGRMSWGDTATYPTFADNFTFADLEIMAGTSYSYGGNTGVTGTLTVNGALVPVSPANLLTVNHLSIAPAGTVTCAKLYVSGNIVAANTEAFGGTSVSGRTVVFIGTAPQTISDNLFFDSMVIGADSGPATTTSVSGKVRANSVDIKASATFRPSDGSQFAGLFQVRSGGTFMPAAGASIVMNAIDTKGAFQPNQGRIIFGAVSWGAGGGVIPTNGDLTLYDVVVPVGSTLRNGFTVDTGTLVPGTGGWFIQRSAIIDGSLDGALTFNGTTAEAISGGGSIAASSVAIDNVQGVTSSMPVSTSTLSLTNGRFVFPASTLTVKPSGTITRVNGWVDGTLRQTAGSSTVYPLGGATTYSPAIVQGTAVVDVRAFDGAGPVSLGSNALRRYWTVATDGSTSMNLTFTYATSDVPVNEAALQAAYRGPDGAWAFPGGTIDINLHKISFTGITRSGEFSAGRRATQFSVGPINGGANPRATVPFTVVVGGADSNGGAALVQSSTDFTLALDPSAAGSGNLGGTVSGGIGANAFNTTASVTYSTASSGVRLRASGLSLSTGTSASFTIAGNAASVTVTSSPASPAYGQTVTFSATLSPTSATGSVQFQIDGVLTSPVTLSSGVATYATSSLATGTHSVNAIYGGDSTYAGATGTLTGGQVIKKATPAITWASPSSITYGAALGAAQLNATSTTPGSFAYTPVTGTILDAGTQQTLTAVFTPTDSANYNAASATVKLDVAKAEQTITWTTPASVTSGTALSGVQLNASISGTGPAATGVVTYTPPVSTTLNAGVHQALRVDVASTSNYNAATATVYIDVAQSAAGAAFTSVRSGDWNSASTWGGSATPGPNDSVTIAAGHVITATTPMKAASVVMNNANLQPPTGSEFGALSLSGGTFAPALGATVTMGGGLWSPATFVANEGTIVVGRTSWGAGCASPMRLSGAFANLTIGTSCSATLESAPVIAGTLTVNGTLQVSGQGLAIGTSAGQFKDIVGGPTGSMTFGADINVSGSITSATPTLFGAPVTGSTSPIIFFNGASGVQTVSDNLFLIAATVKAGATLTGKLRANSVRVLSGGTFQPREGTEVGEVSSSGAVAPAFGASWTAGGWLAASYAANNGTVIFGRTSWGEGATVMDVAYGGPFFNLTIAAGATVQPRVTLTVTSTLAIYGTFDNRATAHVVHDLIGGPSGSFISANSDAMRISGNVTTANPALFGAVGSVPSYAITFDGSGLQTVSDNIYLPSFTVGTATRTTLVSGKMRASGGVTIAAGSTLRPLNGSEFAGSLNGGGILAPESGSTITMAGISVPGVVTFNPNNGLVVIQRASWGSGNTTGITLTGQKMHDLRISSGISVTFSSIEAGGSVEVYGSLTGSGNATLHDVFVGPAGSFSFGKLYISGNLTGPPSLFGLAGAITSPVVFNGNTPQTVSDDLYMSSVSIGADSGPATTTTVTGKIRAMNVNVKTASKLQLEDGSEVGGAFFVTTGGTLAPDRFAAVSLGGLVNAGTWVPNESTVTFGPLSWVNPPMATQTSGNLTLHSVVVPSGASVTTDSTWTIQGNLKNDGAINLADPQQFTGAMTFNGSSAQTISGAGTIGASTFVVDNASGLTSTNAITTTTLTLTNGRLALASAMVTVKGSVARTNGWVDGTLRRTVAAPGALLYPVGGATYSPVTVTPSTLNGSLDVRAVEGVNPLPLGSNALRRYWTVASSAPATADFEFTYAAGDVPLNEQALLPATRSAAGWSFANGLIDVLSHKMTVSGVAASGDFSAGRRATQFTVGPINEGVSPKATLPFPVVVNAADSDGGTSIVQTATDFTVSLDPLSAGNGTLGGTVSGSIPASAVNATLAGVTYSTGATGVRLRATRGASGDSLAAGTSTGFTVTGATITTALALTTSNAVSIVGQSVTFTATVTPSAATGSITFNVDGANVAMVPIAAGRATYSTAALSIGSHNVAASYGGDVDYLGSAATLAGGQQVGKATPVITWATPAAITYGTALSTTQLNATADVTGTFVYSPAAGSTLNAGPAQSLTVTFTPTATSTYNVATKTVTIDVNKGSQTITWATPAGITYGTPLSATQLNATVTGSGASATGALTYTPALNTILNAGPQQLRVDVAATSNYDAATKTVTINVAKGQQTITWATPAGITYGTPLSATQLNATVAGSGASATGALTYTPALNTILNAGPQQLQVDVAATSNYDAATKTVTINVAKGEQTINWSNPAPIVYGDALSAVQLNATVSNPTGSPSGIVTYAPPAGEVLPAGAAQPLTVSVAATANYAAATRSVTIDVEKANQQIIWSAPAAMRYGTPLGATQLNATAVGTGPAGTGPLTYSPPAGTVLPSGLHQQLKVDADATDNYNSATATVLVDVLGLATITAPEGGVTNATRPVFRGVKASNATTVRVCAKADAACRLESSICNVTGLPSTPNSAWSCRAAVSLPPGANTYVAYEVGAAGDLVSPPVDFSLYVNMLPATVDTIPASRLFYPAYGNPVPMSGACTAGESVVASFRNSSSAPWPSAGNQARCSASCSNGSWSCALTLPFGIDASGLDVVISQSAPDATLAPDTVVSGVTVARAPSGLTWPAPEAITYGTAISDVQLNATASVPGTFSYSTAAGAVLNAGTHSLSVRFTPFESDKYTTDTAGVTLTVRQATPAVTWSSPAAITYGTALTTAQLNATSSVAGTFAYNPSLGTVLDAATGRTLSVTFTPDDATNYTAASKQVTIDVSKADQSIQWPNPSKIVYGTPLSASQLNANVIVAGPAAAGAAHYSPDAGAILNAGAAQTLRVSVDATNNYNAASASVLIDVDKGSQSIQWPAPADITYGTPLGAVQLNATVSGSGPSPAGAVTYSPAAGTILNAGASQLLTVSVAGTSNYNAATSTALLNVGKASQQIHWTRPAGITYGTALDATQLNATVSVVGPDSAGALTYTPSAGAIVHAGTRTLSVHAAETANYHGADASVSIDVAKARQTIIWSNPPDIVYGASLNGELNATLSTGDGVLTYLPPAGTLLEAGANQTLTVTAAETEDFEPASASVVINVLKAEQTISWNDPAGIVYGTPLGAAQLNATVTAGALTYDPPAGTILHAGEHQSLHVSAAATKNYNAASADVFINVAKAPQTISWSSPEGITYGTPLSGAQLNARVIVVGPAPAGAMAYTPANGTLLPAGSATLGLAVAETADYLPAFASVILNVAKADQVISWSNPSDIVYGTALGGAQLNATVQVVGPSPAGALAYTPAAGAILTGGIHALNVTVAETSNYNSASAHVAINVEKATQTIAWSAPAGITYGSKLGSVQLNATVSVGGPAAGGTVTYTPPGGTLLSAGAAQTLAVSAAETVNYKAATKSVTIDVNRAPLTITADDKSREFGRPNPPLTATYSGFVNAEGPAALITQATLTTPASVNSTAGEYAITAAGATSPNYAIQFRAGKFVIVKATTAVTVASATAQYSDYATLSASVAPSLGGRTPSGSVEFSVNGVSVGSSAVDGSANATLRYQLNRSPDTYNVTAAFTSSDVNFGNATSTAAPLVVKQEDARATYDGTTFVSTASTVYVPLHATIADSSDGNPGNLANARVSFINRDTNEPIATNLALVVNGGTGAADFQWPVTITSTPSKKSDGSNGKSFVIATVVTGYYTRNATYDDALVMVAEPAVHNISGGGYRIVGTGTGTGSKAPDAGSRLNFSFNVVYDNPSSVTGGFIDLLARSGGRVLRFRGVPAKIDGVPPSGIATVIGSGNVADISDPLYPIDLGAAKVQLDITDRNNLGNTLAVTVSQEGIVMFAIPKLKIDNGAVQMH